MFTRCEEPYRQDHTLLFLVLRKPKNEMPERDGATRCGAVPCGGVRGRAASLVQGVVNILLGPRTCAQLARVRASTPSPRSRRACGHAAAWPPTAHSSPTPCS